jgi:site-specific DNA-cytosine methylase
VSDLTFIDCQGLGGAWTLGTAQAGFEVVHRASLGAFGDELIDANRHLVPGPWEQDTGGSWEEWEPKQASYLAGTPPCSGFSLLNKSKQKNARGPDSAINSCMFELVKYASRCTGRDGESGPEVVAFESVQGAGKQGRELMRTLRATLEGLTGQRYDLSHVFMSGSTTGAAQMRHRYFFVCHRIPFGIDPPEKRRVATYEDAIGDLQGLDTSTWDAQAVAYNSERTWWLREQGMLGDIHPQYTDSYALGDSPYYIVDAHVEPDNARIRMMLEEFLPYWDSGKSLEDAMRGYLRDKGELPEKVRHQWLYDVDRLKGYTFPSRIRPNRPGYVLTGGGVFGFVHWSEPRFLTVRECARLMGYPDAWTWKPARNISQASAWIGKCCPVSSGRWISSWVRRALEGTPGTALEQVGEREYSHNSTLLYKPWLKEQQA